MNAVRMVARCGKHQLPPSLQQFRLWQERCRVREMPTPNLLIRTYSEAEDHVIGADGVDQAILTIKEA